MNLIDTAVLRLVDGYRAGISPRKGWKCAAGAAGLGSTCSTVIRNSIAGQGVARSVAPAARQFAQCAGAAHRLGRSQARVEGVCCCGPIPIPFRF